MLVDLDFVYKFYMNYVIIVNKISMFFYYFWWIIVYLVVCILWKIF